MSIKHTPGPWEIVDGVSADKKNGGHVGTIDIRLGDDDNWLWLADVKPYGGENFPDYETAKANARLIAAAPEMYALLEILTSVPLIYQVDEDKILLAKIQSLLKRIAP